MFQGFTQDASAFLWELRFHNERPWFLEHKEQFETALNRPFRALAADTHALMQERWPEMDFQLHTARIYRDARRLYGQGPYKDHLWFMLYQGRRDAATPVFWFEIGAAVYSYGVGFWSATSAQMAAFRQMVDANPARFARLVEPLSARPEIQLWGESYRRPKGDHGALINPWYNRKCLSAGVERDFGGALFDAALPTLLADEYGRLMELYRFFVAFGRAGQPE